MTENVQQIMQVLGQQARQAARFIAAASTKQKNQALTAMADAILAARDELKQANAKDLAAGQANGLDAAMLDRLALTDAVIDGMAEGLRQVAGLQDPVGEVSHIAERPSGIKVGKMRVPIGVIGIIYESRPNVTVDAAALCLKSGNAAVLRGGSEAIYSNQAIAKCVQQGLRAADLPDTAVQLVPTTDRAAVGQMIAMPEFVDVIIPRGGKGLIERISKEATVPVIKHLDGICHVYIDADADLSMAENIAFNAKTHRYGVCNAMETLLVHQAIAADVLPSLCAKYLEKGVELRGCERAVKASQVEMSAATEADWASEYLDAILSIRVVDDMQQAMAHIAEFSSGHTESIVTNNHSKAMQFLREVDSSSVMVNASTRFADGFEYGLGAEIGISTNKLHARGPVGLEGLTTQKYVVFGQGEIRS